MTEEKTNLSKETQDQKALNALKARAGHVVAHERQHAEIASAYITDGPNYIYEQGTDGQQYAVNGEIEVDLSCPSDPIAAIQKARILREAALAPLHPSLQDYQVAEKAIAMEITARQRWIRERKTRNLSTVIDTDVDVSA